MCCKSWVAPCKKKLNVDLQVSLPPVLFLYDLFVQLL
jgi:hypothetical protein